MSRTIRQPVNSRVGLIGGGMILGAALVLALLVQAGGWYALLAIVGVAAFGVFLKHPIVGLYCTTALLLVAGSSATIGPFNLAIPGALTKVCGAAAVVAWLLNVFLRKGDIHTGWGILLVGAFLAWALLGIADSAYWRNQLPEWIRLAILGGYLILAVNLLDDERRLHGFVMVILFCGLFMSMFAVAQYLVPGLQFTAESGIAGVGSGADKAFLDYEGVQSGPAVRVSGGAGHSTWLALALLMILPLNAYWFAKARTWRVKALASFAVLCEVMALVLTFTRMGLLVGIVVLVVMMSKRLVKANPYRVSALAVGLLCAWFVLPTAYKERVLSFTQYAESSSTENRLALQGYAWEYAQDRPFVGQGIGGFGLRLQEETTTLGANLRWLIDTQGWNPVHYGPHNFYLQLACDTGVVGLVIVLALLAVLFYRTLKAQQSLTGRADALEAGEVRPKRVVANGAAKGILVVPGANGA